MILILYHLILWKLLIISNHSQFRNISFKKSILTSFLFNTNKVYSLNTILLDEIIIDDNLSNSKLYYIYHQRIKVYINEKYYYKWETWKAEDYYN